MEEPVLVAIRARPLLPRELELKQKCVLQMGEQITSLHDGQGGGKDYQFKHNFWSVDKTRGPVADNKAVFRDFGAKLVDNVTQGFNSALIAYGETSAGKSHTLFGMGDEPGVAQLALDAVLAKVAPAGGCVVLSMFSLYDEKVRDMLAPATATQPKGGLRIVDPAAGAYLHGLTQAAATTGAEASALISQGLAARAVASTRMNSLSSRCHVFVKAAVYATADEDCPPATMTIVDLAGNEALVKLGDGAAASLAAESASINKSLSCLHAVVDALAKNGSQTAAVPYTRSKLTWLLRPALGGDCRTLVLGVVSPAQDAFAFSRATLRFADRLQRLRCRPAKASKDASARVVREIEAEVARLQQARADRGLAPGGKSFSSLTDAQKDEYAKFQQDIEMWQAVLARVAAPLSQLKAKAAADNAARAEAFASIGLALAAGADAGSGAAHLVSLDADPLLNGRLRYRLDQPVHRVCKRTALPPPSACDIVVDGLQLQSEHAKLQVKDDGSGAVALVPAPNARVYVDGVAANASVDLAHGNKLLLGANLAFVFEAAGQRVDPSSVSYDSAQWEISKAAIDSMIGLDDVVLKQSLEEAAAQRAADKARLTAELESSRKGCKLSEEQFTAKLADVTARIAAAHKEGETKLAAASEADAPNVRFKVGERARVVAEERAALIADWDKTKSDYAARDASLSKQIEALTAADGTDELSESKKAEAAKRRKLKERALMRLFPAVNEANAICVEMGQTQVRTSVKLAQANKTAPLSVAPTVAASIAGAGGASGPEAESKSADGSTTTSTSTSTSAGKSDSGVLIKVKNTDTDVEVEYSEDAFGDLLFQWRELYNALLEHGERNIPAKDDENPFHIVPVGPQLIGTCRLQLQGLFYLLNTAERTPIIDYKGDAQGKLDVQCYPVRRGDSTSTSTSTSSSSSGKDDDDDEVYFPEDDMTAFENESIAFVIRIRRATGLPKRLSKHVFVRYVCFFEGTTEETEPTLLTSVNARIDYKRTVRVEVMTKELIASLHTAAIELQVFGEYPSDADVMRADPTWQRLVAVVDQGEHKAARTVKRIQRELDVADRKSRGVLTEGDEAAAANDSLADDVAADAEETAAKPTTDPEKLMSKISEAYERQIALEKEKAALERRLLAASKEAQEAMIAAQRASKSSRSSSSSSSSSKGYKKDKKDKREGSVLSPLAEEGAEDSVSRLNNNNNNHSSSGLSEAKLALAEIQQSADVARAMAAASQAQAEKESLRARLAENQQKHEAEASDLASLRAELEQYKQQLREEQEKRKADRQAMVQAAYQGDDQSQTLATELKRQEQEAEAAKQRLADVEAELARSKAVLDVLKKSKEDALREEREEREAKEKEHEEEVARLREALKRERAMRAELMQGGAGAGAGAGAAPAAGAGAGAGARPAAAGGRPAAAASSNQNAKSGACTIM